MKKSLLVVLLFAVSVTWVAFNQKKWNGGNIAKWDVAGYYLYLPATFIYHQPLSLSFYDSLDKQYQFAPGFSLYGQYRQAATGKTLNKYALGTALGELPLFLVAHAWCTFADHEHKADGFSPPYQMAIALSTICWAVIGLLLCGAVLRRFFSDNIAAFTLFGIAFGTNLLLYSSLEFGMSHTWLFMLFAAVLFYSERLYRAPAKRYAIALGVFLGLVFISRPVDILVILVPLFWPLPEAARAQGRWQFWRANGLHFVLTAVSCFLVSALQLAYWKAVTGHFVHFAYEEERFIFSDPQIINGLFSYKKGWFVYTPLAFVAFTGFLLRLKDRAGLVLPALLFYPPFIFVVFSWHCWWYGWGFGARPMVDALPVLALLLACFLELLWKKHIATRTLGILIVCFCVWLNVYQSFQYHYGTMHGDRMNKKYYWRVWNRMHISDADRELLD